MFNLSAWLDHHEKINKAKFELAKAKFELAKRRLVYARQVATGRMDADEADRAIADMEAAIAKHNETQGD